MASSTHVQRGRAAGKTRESTKSPVWSALPVAPMVAVRKSRILQAGLVASARGPGEANGTSPSEPARWALWTSRRLRG